MSRDASGTYTLTGPIPVVTSTVISATMFNNEMADMALEITDSLSRSGKGGMTAALRGIDGAVGAPAFSWTSETNTGLYRVGAGETRWSVLGIDRVVVRNSVVAVTSSTYTYALPPLLQGSLQLDFAVQGLGYQSIDRYFNDANGPALGIRKSRNATIGANTIVQNGDVLGQILFYGADGTTYSQGAQIVAQLDGVPGVSDMPTSLSLNTSPDGSNNPLPRVTISSAGLVKSYDTGVAALVHTSKSLDAVGNYSITKYMLNDQTITASTTLVDATDLVSYSLEADTVYEIEGYLDFTVTNVGGTIIQIVASAVEQAAGIVYTYGANATASARTQHVNGLSQWGSVPSGGAGDLLGYHFKGFVHSNVAGSTLKLQWSQNTAIGNTVLKRGSWLRITRCGIA